MDGICSLYASLHLCGPCASSGAPAPSSASPKFGPWMAAIRRRRPPQEQRPIVPEQPSSAASPVSKDGWMVPKKLGRRMKPPSPASVLGPLGQGSERGGSSSSSPSALLSLLPSSVPPSSSNALVSVSVGADLDLFSGSRRLLSVPVGTVADSQFLSEGRDQTANLKSAFLRSEGSEGKSIPKLGFATDIGIVTTTKESHPGPSKRARPVEPLSQRMTSRSAKVKGKTPLVGKSGGQESFSFSASSGSGRRSDALSGSGTKKSRCRAEPALVIGSAPPSQAQVESCSHEAAVLQLKQAILQSDTAVFMDSAQSVDCPGPEELLGDSAVLMDSAQSDDCCDGEPLESAEEASGVLTGVFPNPAPI